MSTSPTAGQRFREALAAEQPLQIIGAINANHALLAKRAGFKAIYLSGGGVAAGSLGMPDLGIISLDDVLTDVRRITDVCDTPLIVDIDTGFGPSAFNIARTIKGLTKFGAAGCHIEDQVGAKRCGHRPGKEVVSTEEMRDRVKAAVDARTDDSFYIIARTDAAASEGIEGAVARAKRYLEAGADAIFPEALTNAEMFRAFAKAMPGVKLLANMTEFGRTPFFTASEFEAMGYRMVIWPVSALRAANKAQERVFAALQRDGGTQKVIDQMQTRQELYDTIRYHEYEALDASIVETVVPQGMPQRD